MCGILGKSSFSFNSVSWITLFATWSLFAFLDSSFIDTTPSFDLTGQNVTIQVTQECEDEFRCHGFNSTSCQNADICTETKTCNGRTDFPALQRPLQSWQTSASSSSNKLAACATRDGIPEKFDGKLSFDQTVRALYVNGSAVASEPCNAQGNLADYDTFTLVFWLYADCTNCSVLELSQEKNRHIHLRVADGMLCVTDECPGSLEKGSWTFIAVKVYKRALTVFAKGEQLNVSSTHLQDVTVENIFIGSNEVTAPENEFVLYDVSYYGDILTKREMEELRTGMPNLFDPCRCPPSHPVLSASSTECQDEIGDLLPLYNITVHFKPVSILLNHSSQGKWASSEKGNVTLVLTFSLPYEMESVKIDFASAVPAFASISLERNQVESSANPLQCTGFTCDISFQANSPSISVNEHKAKLADKIKIVLGRASPSDVQSFIISKISINGRCDCHGNAETCNVTNGSYTCNCKEETNTAGSHCKSCAPNFFREATDFDCPNSCSCSPSGVVDANDQCEEVGGQCKCKDLVTGPTCDQCKPWTYGLDPSNEKGCSQCSCALTGSTLCNNVTGECICKTNALPPDCDGCKENHYGLDSAEGCRPCSCETIGTRAQKLTCHEQTGQCECKDNVMGLQCDQCQQDFYSLDVANPLGCAACDCHPVGTTLNACDTATGQCSCRNGVTTDKKCTPKINSVDPTFGPVIGGTKITIKGQLLGNSSQAFVFLGTMRQIINEAESEDSRIIVDTVGDAAALGKNQEMKLSWQNGNQTVSLGSFSYMSNPTLDASKAVDTYSYLSGGCLVNVYGTNLKNVKYPKLEVFNKANPNAVAHGSCKPFRDYVICFTPNVKHLHTSPQDQFHMTVAFDGVRSSSMGRIFIRNDPVIDHVGNIRFQYPFEKTITLYGKDLQTACQLNGIEVLTGVIGCQIISVSNTSIECQPTGSSPGGDNKRIIKVSVGRITKVVGTLEYLEFYETDVFIIICCTIVGIILLVVIILIVCRYRRYRNQRSRAHSKLTDSRDTSNRQMNTYSEITQLVNTTPTSNGHSGMVLMENIVPEHKKGIVNTQAETSVFTDEVLPYVEPGIREGIKEMFVGENSFKIGPCIKTGKHAKLFDGILLRNGVEIQKLSIRSLLKPISEVIKTAPESTSGPMLASWANLTLSECLRLKRFKHNHILNGLGVGISYQRFHLLYAHTKKGNLKDLVADTSKEFSVRQLLGFSQQIASGVAFLASKDITHKDVAARNCVVDEFSIVKIGDASFSWDFYPKEYVYNEQRERHLPIRWMAPESLTDGYYDMRSDVWSFGVLVWELLTRGCLPFHEVSDDQVTDYVLNGYILGKPETISDNVYDMLRNCWSPENETRPSMASLSRSLSIMLESETEDETYANSYLVTAQLTQGVSTPRRGINTNGNAQFYCSTDLSHV